MQRTLHGNDPALPSCYLTSRTTRIQTVEAGRLAQLLLQGGFRQLWTDAGGQVYALLAVDSIWMQPTLYTLATGGEGTYQPGVSQT